MTLHITPDSSPRTVTLQPGARVLIRAGSKDVLVVVEDATTLTPGLPEGWEWVSVPLFVAYAANREAGVWIGLDTDGDLHINGGFGRTINHADAAAVRAVLARAGVTP